MGMDSEPSMPSLRVAGAQAPAGVAEALLPGLHDEPRRIAHRQLGGGMTEEGVADALGVTERTVWRDWIKAKGWLVRELEAADVS
jgi:ECF sigma factor